MSEEIKEKQYRDNRTSEICTLVSREVALADEKKVFVPYAVYARGHERALEEGEEKYFEEVKEAEPVSAEQTLDNSAPVEEPAQ